MNRFVEPWFPLSRELMENTHSFTFMPVSYRLYFWKVISDFNLNGGPFRKRDCDFARQLSLSVPTIRRARKEIKSQGWLEQNGREYTRVVQPGMADMLHPGQECKQFARVNRKVFDRLLEGVKEGSLLHEDVALYIYAWSWRWFRGWAKRPDFSIPKGKLAALVGIDDPVPSIMRLGEFPFFSESIPPFRFSGIQGDVLAFKCFKTFDALVDLQTDLGVEADDPQAVVREVTKRIAAPHL